MPQLGSRTFSMWWCWVCSVMLLDLMRGGAVDLSAQVVPPLNNQPMFTTPTFPQIVKPSFPVRVAAPTPGSLVLCPSHDGVVVINGTGTDTTTVLAFATPGEITLMPEYHDCQRFA